MKAKLLSTIVILTVIFIGCDGSGISIAEKMNFVDDFMQTFEYERSISSVSDRSAQPLIKGILSGESIVTEGARATIPAHTSALDFAETTGSFDNYPYPGQTTSYALESAAAVGTDVYMVTSTTAYPEASNVLNYVEVYYVRDISTGTDAPSEAPADTDPDGIWNADDPIVGLDGMQDQSYRVSMTVNFSDGSVRNEYIVKIPEAGEGFAAFDVYGSLEYPDFSYPETDESADYSSVVLYTYEKAEDYDYSFWAGAENQYVVGVRYYSEHITNGGNETRGTLVSYERAVSQFTADDAADTNGNLLNTMGTVFNGTSFATLAETVFRQEVIFDLTGNYPVAITLESQMKSHVVNASSYEDFLIERINEDEAELSDFDGASYFIPSGKSADEIVAEDYTQNEFLVKTTVYNPDGEDVVIIDTPPNTSDLADLYIAINNGVLTETIDDPGNDIPDTLEGSDGAVSEFDGDVGQVVAGSDPDSDDYDPAIAAALDFSGNTAGTVMAWVYVYSHMDTAGIVHKGVESDFSDEAYSLQFMGDKGNVAFAVVEQDPSYKYSYAKSTVRLNTNKWYFLAGTFETGEAVKVYVFGEDMKKDYYVKSSNNKIDNIPEGGPLVLGSQFTEEQRLNGYYGFDGLINGVVVKNDEAMSAEALAAYYDTYNDFLEFWPVE